MKTVATILVIVVLLLMCVACTSRPSTPTITFEDDQCSYSGPDSVQADQFAFTWANNSQKNPEFSVYVVQVEEGQSVDDLVGKDVAPSWLSTLRYESSSQPGPWTKELTYDLTASARFQPGLVYFLCVHNDDETFGVAGPVTAAK